MLRALILLIFLGLPASARTVLVEGDWVRLGDVVDVRGDARERQIAAAPAPGGRMPLSPDFLAAQITATGQTDITIPSATIWVERRVDAVRERPRTTPAIDTSGKLPVLNKDFRRGEVISAGDVDWISEDKIKGTSGAVTSDLDLIGYEAKRTLRAGRAIRHSDIKTASVVRKGEPVTLVYRAAGLKLTVDAKALSDGAKGETVRVVNLQSNRSMDAIAWSPGVAHVSASESVFR